MTQMSKWKWTRSKNQKVRLNPPGTPGGRAGSPGGTRTPPWFRWPGSTWWRWAPPLWSRGWSCRTRPRAAGRPAGTWTLVLFMMHEGQPWFLNARCSPTPTLTPKSRCFVYQMHSIAQGSFYLDNDVLGSTTSWIYIIQDKILNEKKILYKTQYTNKNE